MSYSSTLRQVVFMHSRLPLDIPPNPSPSWYAAFTPWIQPYIRSYSCILAGIDHSGMSRWPYSRLRAGTV